MFKISNRPARSAKAAYAKPTPNCGHGGTLWTWVSLAELWMCPLCYASIGKLYRVCAWCLQPAVAGVRLVEVRGVGAVCVRCKPGVAAQLRFGRVP